MPNIREKKEEKSLKNNLYGYKNLWMPGREMNVHEEMNAWHTVCVDVLLFCGLKKKEKREKKRIFFVIINTSKQTL